MYYICVKNMIDRIISKKLIEYSKQFRAVALTGPRQCGKTTLCRYIFPHKPYVNFENIDTLNLAYTDPIGFLYNYKETGCVLDEIQKAPKLFNYLQQILDEDQERGKYILTGSSNFLLNENISQSLAGRIGYINMLPLSVQEIKSVNPSVTDIWELIFKGGYPEIWSHNIKPEYYYPAYIQSVIEKDIRQLVNIRKWSGFQQFVKLAATRIGQEWNSNKAGNELGVDAKTISSWISYLQISGIVYFLPPLHNNFGKRVIKKPKLYFIDTGIASSLLGIQNIDHLETHPLKGELFENFIIMNLVKQNTFRLNPVNLYFWRSNDGIEIDLIIENANKLIPVEIKSGMTFNNYWWRNIDKWQKFSGNSSKSYIIYNGNNEMKVLGNKIIINSLNVDLSQMLKE